MTEKTKIIVVGHKMYARCSKCGNIVRLNKPLIGGLHVCTPD